MTEIQEAAPAPPAFRVSARERIEAPPDRVYRLIADYHEGHPRIVPPEYFRNIVVEHGGYGAGTRIVFDMQVMGSTRQLRALIEEPEPGRVLIERYPEDGSITTFVVDPAGAAASDVTIATEIPWKRGLAAKIERWMAGRVLPKIYRAELARIGQVATEG